MLIKFQVATMCNREKTVKPRFHNQHRKKFQQICNMQTFNSFKLLIILFNFYKKVTVLFCLHSK